jgi:hypothetical protein
MNQDLLTENFPIGIDLRMIRRNYTLVRILFVFASMVVIIGFYDVISTLSKSTSSYQGSVWSRLYPYIRMATHILYISANLYLLLGYRKIVIALEQDDVQTFNTSFKFFYTCNMIALLSFIVEFGSMALVYIK